MLKTGAVLLGSPAAVLDGRARCALVQGEALAELVALPGEVIDAVVTDPPYSSGGQYRGDRMARTSTKYVNSDAPHRYPNFDGDTRDQRSFAAWCALWLSQCLRVARQGAPLCMFSDWRQLPSVTDAIQAGGWLWRGIAVWDKTEAVRPVLGRFRAQCEFVVWGSKGAMSVARPVPVLPGVIRERVDPRAKVHASGKPASVMARVNAICEPGGVILDPFIGSGSTAVAALAAGYRVIGIELNPDCYELARSRVLEAGEG